MQVLVRRFLIRAISSPKFINCHTLASLNSLELSKVYPHIQLPSANAQTVKAEPWGFIIASGADGVPTPLKAGAAVIDGGAKFKLGFGGKPD